MRKKQKPRGWRARPKFRAEPPPELAVVELFLDGGANYDFDNSSYCLAIRHAYDMKWERPAMLLDYGGANHHDYLALSGLEHFYHENGRPCARVYASISRAKALKPRLTSAAALKVRILFKPTSYGITDWAWMGLEPVGAVRGEVIGYEVADGEGVLMPWTSMKQKL